MLIAAAVLASGLALTAWAKKPDKPPGGGGGKEEPRYTIVDLGALDSISSYARSINELGQVAGFSFTYSPGGYCRAFLVTPEYDSDGNPVVWFRDDDLDGINDLMMDIGTLVGDSSSRAYGVNDSGQVVGGSYGDVDGTDRQHAFLWDSISGMIDLGSLEASNGNSMAWGISNSGYVVGYVSNYPGSDERRAFIVVPEDTDGDGVPDTWFRDTDGDGYNDLMIDLGTLPGDSGSSAFTVNDSGQVVGSSDSRGFLITPEDSDGDGVLEWFLDDGSGGNALMIELGPLSGADTCSAEAINFSGQVVGWSTVHNTRHAVLWEVDELDGVTLTDLGKVKGATSATSINDAGQVVGHGQIWPNKLTAFLWENGKMTKLIDLLANSEGIGSLTALGINESGEIVGHIYGDGYHHAYIALPIPAAP